jgi:Kef-type K+ transport system membrane component KefB
VSGTREHATAGAAGWLARRFRLRFPTLFLIFAVFLGVDLVVPDVIPFLDEIGLALLTLLLGLWKSRRRPGAPSPDRDREFTGR